MLASLICVAGRRLCDGICLGLIWRPILTPAQIALAAAALGALTGFAYLRTWKAHPWASTLLMLMRLAVLAGLIVLLLGPSDIPSSASSSQRTKVMVVLDLSESMLTRDCQGETRLDVARNDWLSSEYVDRLNRRCALRLFGFGERVRPMSWSELGPAETPVMDSGGTHLAQSLLSVISGPRASGDLALLVLSDGHDTADADLQPVASLARSRGIPIHTVALGTENQQQDLVVLAVPMQDYCLPGEAGAILVRVYQFGLPEAQTVLHVRHGEADREIPISFDGRADVELQVEVRSEQPGEYEYEISVEPLPIEVEQKNNDQTVFYQVQDRRIRVLLLEGQPYWDTKFLAQSLRKDERIELTQITQVAPQNRETLVSRSNEPLARIPSTPEQWSEFDVVILGNELQTVLDHSLAAQLSDFVLQQGGHVVFARGRCYDPAEGKGQAIATSMSSIEPVVWDDRVWRDLEVLVTPGAVESSWLGSEKMGQDPARALSQLPGLRTIQGVRRLKPATRVLVEAAGSASNSTHPAIVAMAAGRGQVVALLGHDSWRWSLRPPADDALLNFYDTFWSNLVRWLVMGGDFQPGQQVSLKLSRQSLQRAEPVDVEVVFKDPSAADRPWRVIWTDPEGQDRELSLGRVPGRSPRFRTTLTPASIGVHQFQLLTPTAVPAQQQHKLSVFDVNLERLETSARPLRLKELSEASGGKCLDPKDPDEFLKMIDRQQLAQQIPPEPQYVWDQAGIMTLLLIWIGCEWLLRRLAGLL